MEAGSPGLALPSPFRSDPRPTRVCRTLGGAGGEGAPQGRGPLDPLRPGRCHLSGPGPGRQALPMQSPRARPREPGGAGSAFPSPSPSGQDTACRPVPGLSTAAAGSETPAEANAGPAIGTRRLGAGAGGRARRGGLGVPGSREDAQACSTRPARGVSSAPPLRPLGPAHRTAKPRPSGSESPPPGC